MVITSPGKAPSIASRSEPGPESAVFVTVAARAPAENREAAAQKHSVRTFLTSPTFHQTYEISIAVLESEESRSDAVFVWQAVAEDSHTGKRHDVI
jgi:hypothetical protein